MATYFARKAGNINASDVWATTPAGTAAAVTFAAGDILMANSFAITVNVSVNLGGAGQVRNDANGGASQGGAFTLSDSITLTANVITGSSTACVRYQGTSGSAANIVGDCLGGAGTGPHGAHNISTGTLNITGNVIGGAGINQGARNDSTGIINITGNVTGGTAATGQAYGALNFSTGTINITGNVTGGTGVTAHGAFNNSTGILSIIGTVTASQTAPGVAGANVQQTTILSGPFLTETVRGVAPVYCAAWRWNASPSNSTYLEVMTNNLLAKRNLVTADNITGMPAASNVKTGVTYGPSSELTGTFSQTVTPSTADIATAVWGAATRTITGGLVDTATTLTNAPTVPSVVQIRQEMDANSTKLSNLDATVSSRLAPNGTLATVTTLTNAPTVPTAAEIATAVEGSLLNEADGQAVLNAIVGAIGNTNISEVALVAAIRTDIERAGGKLDSVPTAAANASAVWGTATKEITGGTVTTLTNSPSVPSAAAIASATRSELAVELARVDASVSSRMAASEASKLDAVKAKTDALNSERLANVATTAIVGNLIAQANS
jgi:hypothetical protein